MTWSLCTTRHGACWRREVNDAVLACWGPTATRATWQWIVTSSGGRDLASGYRDTLEEARADAEEIATLRALGFTCQVCGQPCPSSESHLCERCERIARAS